MYLFIRNLFVRLPYDGTSRSRYLSILRGGLSAVAAKGISAVALMVSVPLTLSHLGPERYGLWVTLYSIIAWFSLFDLGLSNSLLSLLSEAFGKGRNDLARKYISVAVQGLILIAIIAGIVCIALSFYIDWASFLKIRNPELAKEFFHAVLTGIVFIALGLPLTVVGKIYTAYQKGELANAWSAAGTLGGLIGLAITVFSGGNMPMLVLGFSGGQMLTNLLSVGWLFGKVMPHLKPGISPGSNGYRRVFKTSTAFFFAQLSALLIFQSPNIIISNRLGPGYVAPFQTTWLLFSYVTIPAMFFGANIWAAIGEAYAKQDIFWIRVLFFRYVKLSLLVGIPFIITLTLFYKPIVMRWVGPAGLAEPVVVYWIAAWALSSTLMHPVVSILAGTGHLNKYALLSLPLSVTSLLLAYLFVGRFGVPGLMAAFVGCLTTQVLLSYVLFLRPIINKDVSVQLK